MSVIADCRQPSDRARGLKAAFSAVRRGDLVVLPTDTVYGLGTDAFSPTGVEKLLAAKGRGRDMPVPVLVANVAAVEALAAELPNTARALIKAFWPGGLTLVVRAQPTLSWDLGDANGTVAVRMPLHPVALELLEQTGPMAVSSANRSGHPPARDFDSAREQLGDRVSVYLDAGLIDNGLPNPAAGSAIVDVTTDTPVVLRDGVIPWSTLQHVVPELQPRPAAHA